MLVESSEVEVLDGADRQHIALASVPSSMLFQPYLGDISPCPATYTLFVNSITKARPRQYPTTDQDQQLCRVLKRPRLDSDVDGESSGHLHCKKRRLRRDLITSRLSKPFATPNTYIQGRGEQKIICCGRTSGSTRNVLRKVALLNWTRQRNAASLAVRRKSCNLRENRAIQEDSSRVNLGSFSPLGVSNYEALDLEGDPYDDEPWVDAGDESVYSNFHQLVETTKDDSLLGNEKALVEYGGELFDDLTFFPCSTGTYGFDLDDRAEISSAVASQGPTHQGARSPIILKSLIIAS